MRTEIVQVIVHVEQRSEHIQVIMEVVIVVIVVCSQRQVQHEHIVVHEQVAVQQHEMDIILLVREHVVRRNVQPEIIVQVER